MMYERTRLSSRFIAAFLTVIMVLNLVPFSLLSSFAAPAGHDGMITLIVTEEDGTTPIKGAYVVYSYGNASIGGGNDKYTGDDGVINAMTNDLFENTFHSEALTFNATITCPGYALGSVNDQITSVDQEFHVSLAKMEGVSVTASSDLVYNEEDQDLVSITAQNDDTVTFTINGATPVSYKVGQDEAVPVQMQDADDYTVSVTVHREGFADFEWEDTITIATLATGIDIDSKTLTYNEDDQELVTLTGTILPTDTVKWFVNGIEETPEGAVPVRKAAGDYTVRLYVNRGSNYTLVDKTVNSEIQLAELSLGDLTIEANELTYTGDAQRALTVTGQGEYTLLYSFTNEETSVWTAYDENTSYPQVTDAQEHTIYVKAVKEGYNDKNTDAFPITVTVQPKQTTISFDEGIASSGTLTLPYTDTTNTTSYTLSAHLDDNTITNAAIQYEIVADQSTAGIAAIDEATGEVTVSQPGVVTVRAYLTGNYTAESFHTLQIASTGTGHVAFSSETDDVTYTLGENSGIASALAAEAQAPGDTGGISYAVENGDDYGLTVDTEGRVIVTSYQALAEAVRNANGTLPVTVTATKAAVKNFLDGDMYPEETASYVLTVSFAATPENAYTVSGDKKIATGEWYTGEVTVTPAAGYSIAQNANGSFEETLTVNTEGTTNLDFYLKNDTTGGITDQNSVVIKLDTGAPDSNTFKVEYGKTTDSMAEIPVGSFGFYQHSVIIRFTASDDTSGVDYVTWQYNRAPGASTLNAEAYEGQFTFNESGYAEDTVTAPNAGQLRGNITYTVYDKAGNATTVTDEGTFVLDTVSPELTVLYTEPTTIVDTVEYYDIDNDSIQFNLTVTEANFYAEDVKVKLSKNGGEPAAITPEWTDGVVADTHIGTYTITGDGDYILSVEYTDRSDNEMVSYTSPLLVIDATEPVITVTYDDDAVPQVQTLKDNVVGNSDENDRVYYADQKVATITIEEHNFNPDEVVFTISAKDVAGNELSSYAGARPETDPSLIQFSEWDDNDDTHVITVTFPGEANYEFAVAYADVATNDDSYGTDYFTVDNTAPTIISVEYSDNHVFPDDLLSALTLGLYYNGKVTVTITAEDTISGVNRFDYECPLEEGVSTAKNKAIVMQAISEGDFEQDPEDPGHFILTFEIPEETLDEAQFNGHVEFTATDRSGNKTEDQVEDQRIVVDNIPPEMEVSYVDWSRMVKVSETSSEWFYNKNATVTFAITEANFYSEDVVFEVTKDGKAFSDFSVQWDNESEDLHIGTLVLEAPADHSKDGHYIINVTYTDRSLNDMTSFTSEVITIDTTSPVINVVYDDDDIPLVQELKGNVAIEDPDNPGAYKTEDNNRKYYADQKTATVTITEHNFNAEDVDFQIVAKDVAGNELSGHTGAKPETDPELIRFSDWSDRGDIHTITITFPGEANYEFDVAYADLATNEAEDYNTDYFTVDKNAPDPKKITVSYSQSIQDMIQELTSYYDAKVKVTITAEDEISGVHKFVYNYRNAPGVSAVNAELINQALEEANNDIKFSNGGKTATVSFEIPKEALRNTNQFNGKVDFTATDRSDNTTEHKEGQRLVVDNIAPVGQVTYNNPVNKVNTVDYYNGQINATVTVTEANFFSEDVQINVTKDGAPYAVRTTWTDDSVDVHVGRFTLTEDGDYQINITYTDRSGNAMTPYTSNQLTIDKGIGTPTFRINGVARSGEDGKAYKEDVEVEFAFDDENFDTKAIKLTRVRYDESEDVYDSEKAGVNDLDVTLAMNDNGGSGSFTIPSEKVNDGIYTLTIRMSDKSLHTSEAYVKFAVTRFGPVFEYGPYLASLIKDGGQYVKSENGAAAITGDLVIKEYNAVPLTNDSLKISITRDGEAIDADYTTTPSDVQAFETVDVGNSGWYEYVYTIKASNFAQDGAYRITLSTAYDALDASNGSVSTTASSIPENSVDENGDAVLDYLKFTVDTTAPEIRNVVNLDKEIADRDKIVDGKLTVSYTIIDLGGLKSVEVIVNGKSEVINSFENAGNFSGSFVLEESSAKQTVQIKVTDLAGNVTDTSESSFRDAHKSSEDLYIFHGTVTVSTNFFVRWFANAPLFWGSIGGVVVVAGGAGALITRFRKKKSAA